MANGPKNLSSTLIRGVRTLIIGRNPRWTVIRLIPLVLLAAIAIITCKYILVPIRISGPSMFPTYRDGQINFINRFAYHKHEPQRGDVVGIIFSGPHLMYVKRIVGLPGEAVCFKDGRFEINGTILKEPYVRDNAGDWNSPVRHLGSDEYYVVGDNRSMPFKDHDKGAASRKRILGKILLEP